MSARATTVVRTITAAWLREQNACEDQVAIFEAEWDGSAPLTRENLERAVALKLDLEWFAGKMLTAPALAEYRRAKYERVRAAALAEYRRVTAPALAEYRLAEYERVTAAALAEYERVTAAALIALLCEPENLR